MKRVVAVTGGIACGKSTVALTLQKLGCAVLDTDEVAHRLESSGGAAVPVLAEAFGKTVIAADGAIDRRRLGALVFADSSARERLDSILHPMIEDKVREWLSVQSDDSVCVVLVPLLFESKFDKSIEWDAVIAVVCSEDEQVRRVCSRGFDENEARARISAQMPCREKAARSDYTIWNDGTLAALEEETEKAYKAVCSC